MATFGIGSPPYSSPRKGKVTPYPSAKIKSGFQPGALQTYSSFAHYILLSSRGSPSSQSAPAAPQDLLEIQILGPTPDFLSQKLRNEFLLREMKEKVITLGKKFTIPKEHFGIQFLEMFPSLKLLTENYFIT